MRRGLRHLHAPRPDRAPSFQRASSAVRSACSLGAPLMCMTGRRIGDCGLSNDLRYWVNAGLMTLFFFVIGLEARREFDLGELRDRQRVQIPLAAGVGGLLIPVAIFLALNAGRSSAHGWGAAMSTDTAFALGLLALVGSRGPFRLRAFVLTFAVVDDAIALVVIATVYARAVDVSALAEALA